MNSSIPVLTQSLADTEGLAAIVSQFYQDGIVIVRQAIPAALCQALLADV